MAFVNVRTSLLTILCAVALFTQSAHAYYLQLLTTKSAIVGDQVVLAVADLDDKTTHTWKSDHYESLSNLTNSGGIVAYYTTDETGWVRLHTVVYDPVDQKWHHRASEQSQTFSDLTINGGIVAVIDVFYGNVELLTYEPHDHSWRTWTSPAYRNIASLSVDSGVVAFFADFHQFAVAAAYDPTDREWHIEQIGPNYSNTILNLTNDSGVFSVLNYGSTIAEAYDPHDQKWHAWKNTGGIDLSLDNAGTVVAFTHSGNLHSIAYDAQENEWDEWTFFPDRIITNVSVSDGFVSYTMGGITYNHFMARPPKARFVANHSTGGSNTRFAQFTDNSTGNIDSWSWNFGDGTSTKRSPSHEFKKIGEHTVTLKVTGPGGSNTVSRMITVTTPTYTLDYTAGANGSISGDTHQSVKYGSSGTTVTAIADTGYHFSGWSDGKTTNPRRDRSVAENLSVTANFAINQYSVSFVTDGTLGASLTGSTTQTVNYGSSGTSVKAVAPVGWKFKNWTNGAIVYSTSNPITVKNVSSNLTLTAHFVCQTGAGSWELYD